ncbi:MAG: hypothetical protein CFE23_08335 [Flavobacterium sp. BFFFF1]|uniref:DUF4907 domain-containing protein n=1 Tax=Flavobacterium sp. BFFFF1 TaxID=2015557 RepID=UPI000BC900EE|nr:DUF4907 domain-containing protein [Flavobacterium sp. BFFFF1]OYU80717.1 MAG: hypothetical protein CFE23_08335 [Flavobacterium sp. BFFFF1]
MIKTCSITKAIIFVVVFQIFNSCTEKKGSFHGEVYKTETGMFGYRIFHNGKLFIKQETVPALRGNTRFPDSLTTLRTLDLVLGKLNKGMAPGLSPEDMEKIKTHADIKK